MTTPCRTYDRDVWFSEDPWDQLEAVQLCHTCPIEQTCRPMGTGEIHGVWGGVIYGGTRLKLDPIKCGNPECSKEFTPKSTRVRFCSPKCRTRADTIARTQLRQRGRARGRAA